MAPVFSSLSMQDAARGSTWPASFRKEKNWSVGASPMALAFFIACHSALTGQNVDFAALVRRKVWPVWSWSVLDDRTLISTMVANP